MKSKKKCETEAQAIDRYMEDQSRGITYETNKAKHKLGFLNDLRTHTEACIRRPNICMHKVVLKL